MYVSRIIKAKLLMRDFTIKILFSARIEWEMRRTDIISCFLFFSLLAHFFFKKEETQIIQIIHPSRRHTYSQRLLFEVKNPALMFLAQKTNLYENLYHKNSQINNSCFYDEFFSSLMSCRCEVSYYFFLVRLCCIVKDKDSNNFLESFEKLVW